MSSSEQETLLKVTPESNYSEDLNIFILSQQSEAALAHEAQPLAPTDEGKI